MLAEIGIMVGFYIIARMVSFLTRRGERAESPTAKAFSVFAIIVAILCILDLVFRGSGQPGA